MFDYKDISGADFASNCISYNEAVEEHNIKFVKGLLSYQEDTNSGCTPAFFSQDLASNSTEGSETLNVIQNKNQPNFVNIISPNASNSSSGYPGQDIYGEKSPEDNRIEESQIRIEDLSDKESLPSMKADSPNKAESTQSIYKNKYKEALEQAKAIIDEWMKAGMPLLQSARAEEVKGELVWRIEGEALSLRVQDYDDTEVDVEELQAKVQELKDSIKRAKAIEKEEAKVADTIKVLKKQGSKKDNKKWQKQMDKAVAEQSSILKEKATLAQRLPQMKRDEEILTKDLKKLEGKLKPLRAEILKELSSKRYCQFIPIFEQMAQISQYVKKGDSMIYFDQYKKKRSMKYFEAYMKDEELFYWILLLKVVLMFIPSDKDYLNLLPLNKSTSPFMLWLLDSSVMKVKHKELFRESDVRKHLRKEFTRVFNIMVVRAEKLFTEGKWTSAKWSALQQVINAGEETIETVAEDSEKATTEEEVYSPNDSHKRTRDQYELDLNEFSLNEEIPSIEKKVFWNF